MSRISIIGVPMDLGAAIVDTGATRSVIPRHIADELGVTTPCTAAATLADGTRIMVSRTEPVYFAGQPESWLRRAEFWLDRPVVSGRGSRQGQG